MHWREKNINEKINRGKTAISINELIILRLFLRLDISDEARVSRRQSRRGGVLIMFRKIVRSVKR